MPTPSHKTSKYALNIERLTVAYDSDPVLKDITFSVGRGDIVAIIGPNGSGKSTLIKSILGIVRPRSGSIKVFGKHLHEVLDKVGYVPQKFNFDKHFPITVEELLRLSLHKQEDTNIVEETIKEVGLLPSVLKQQLGTLSGGQLQRVLIAQAIMKSPELLILDEPATGIDVVGEAAFYDVIEHLNDEHDTTVILISHDVSMVAQKVDQVICLNRKLLCSGPPKKTLNKKTLDQLFGHSQVYEHHHHDHH